MATMAVQDHDVIARSARSAFETLAIVLLGAISVIWIVFQVVEIGGPFPPIGILYALGSIAVAAMLIRLRKPWTPSVASGWAALMMIPESIPAVGHLRDWSELYTHFGHYLVIMTFFPLAALVVVVGLAATAQNRAISGTGAPSWLRVALVSVSVFIIVANAITIMLYAFEIP